MKVTYDSWQKQYKTPFGAIQANTLVTWAIAIDQPVQEADLWLTKLNEDPVAYPMNYNKETQVRVGSSGLYNYYFAIKQNNQIFYVDQGLFGQGRLVQDDNNLNQYQLTCYERKVPQVDWYDQGVVYQIFPDRFANGNSHGEVTGRKKNSFLYATEEDTPYYIKNTRGEIKRWDFFGGNLAGIRKKIPYLKKLGVTTIYLNPIFLATSNHRYDTVDYMKIDPMLGDEDDLRSLIHDLHQNGIFISKKLSKIKVVIIILGLTSLIILKNINLGGAYRLYLKSIRVIKNTKTLSMVIMEYWLNGREIK